MEATITKEQAKPMLMEAAEEVVKAVLDRSFIEIMAEYGCLPKDIQMACALVVDSLFQQLTPNPITGMVLPANTYRLPYTIRGLLFKYAKPGIDERIAKFNERAQQSTSAMTSTPSCKRL